MDRHVYRPERKGFMQHLIETARAIVCWAGVIAIGAMGAGWRPL